MATTAVAPSRAAARLPRSRALTWLGGTLLLVALVALSIYMRSRVIHGSFWMDEGLSVGIGSHPLTDIPHLLRQDGSPPLYYMLLHVWMSVVGTTEAETHALSLLFSVLTVPVGLWAGWSLFGARAGWICAGLFALNPFLTAYAQETRMYSLLALESLVICGALLHIFVYGRRGYIPLFVVALAAMLYTHGWGIFFGLGALAGVLPVLWAAPDRRRVVVDAVLSFGGAALLFLPWLPTLLYQSAHTAAPWSRSPRFGAPIQISHGLMGGDRATAAMLLAGGFGLAAAWGARGRSRERQSAIVLIVVTVVTLAVAWGVSQVSPAWTTRYFGTVLGPLLLLAALGMARAGVVGIAAFVLVFVFWLSPKEFTSTSKSDIRDLSGAMAGQLRPGDLLIAGQAEQVPAMAYYFGPRLRYASTVGPVRDPYVMDWRDSVARITAARPGPTVGRLLASLRPGQRVLFVRPMTAGVDNWSAPWTKMVRRRSAQWGGILAGDRNLRRIAFAPRFYRAATTVGNSAVLYQKTG